MDKSLHITIDGREIAATLRDILSHLERQSHQGDSLMAIAQSTQDLLANLRARVASLSTEIASGTAGVRSDIATLKSMITSPTPPDPTEVNAALQDIIDALAPVQAAADALVTLDNENPAVVVAAGTGSEAGPSDAGA